MYLDFTHGEPFTLCNQGVRTGGLWGMFLSVLAHGGVPRVSRQERGRANFGLQPGRLTFLMDARVVLLLLSVSPFTRLATRYSGSAAALQEEAAKAAFSSPPHGPTLSPAAYRRDLPTQRAVEGFTGHGSGPFSPGGDTHHRDGPGPTLRTFDPGAGIRVPVSASSRGGVWRTIPAEMPSPEVSLPGPFVLRAFSGPSGGAKLAAYLCGRLQSSSREFCTGADPHR